tara:strand:+ start:896 stop:1948 length:1053 start_codon:yes stop_codon:yes gene_type:complete
MIRSSQKATRKSGINNLLNQFADSNGVGVLSPARYDILISPPNNISSTSPSPFKSLSGNAGDPRYDTRDIYTQYYSQFESPSYDKDGQKTEFRLAGKASQYNRSQTNRIMDISNLTNADVMRRLSLSCEEAAFPGRNISTQPNRIAGPIREIPYESLYSGDLDLTFRIGQDMFERTFFEEWQDRIIDHETHALNYYENYVRDIYIAQLGPDDSIVFQILVKECFPKTIQSIDLGYAKTDEYERQSVSMAFREYVVLDSDTFGGPNIKGKIENRFLKGREDFVRQQKETEERQRRADQEQARRENRATLADVDATFSGVKSSSRISPPDHGAEPSNESSLLAGFNTDLSFD